MRTIKLVVSYDGTDYNGFQRQTEAPSVQGELEKFLSNVCGAKVQITGSGRTDARVHAKYQVVSFTTEGSIPLANLVHASRTMLPQDIVVLQAEVVAPDFNARKLALWKRYVYRLHFCNPSDPFLQNYVWELPERLDVAAMQAATVFLKGEHDFSGFRSTGSAEVNPVKTIYEAIWEEQGQDLYFKISGNGFVYHMVRNLVWSLVQVGSHKLTPAGFKEELQAARGAFESAPAPAQGLYLDYVSYEPWQET
jgi:tRNA pseudouridine38-40 synthase